MRCVFVTQYFPPEIGATPIRIGSVALSLRRAGHEVEVVTSVPNYPEGVIADGYRWRLYRRESWQGVPVHRVLVYPSMGTGLARLVNYASFSMAGLLPLLRLKRADLVFVESPPPTTAITGWVLARALGALMILNVSDLWPDSAVQLGALREGPVLAAARSLEAWAYRRAAAVTAVTEGIAEALEAKKGVPAERVLFLPNGVDTDLFRPVSPRQEVRSSLGLDGGPLLVYAGTLGLSHGLETAIEAMALLAGTGRDIRLAVVGAGTEKARLMRLASNGRAAAVRFIGPQPPETIAGLLSCSFAGLACARRIPAAEGARSAKIFPYMAAGKPVIYSGKGEGSRLISDAESGIVVPPEDPPALSEAIQRLADDPAESARLGANGRALVENRFSWDRLVGDWLSQLRARGIA